MQQRLPGVKWSLSELIKNPFFSTYIKDMYACQLNATQIGLDEN